MQLFENTVKLRGFLGKDAESPSSDRIQEDSFAVLLVATVSGVWDLGSNEWIPRTDWPRIVVFGTPADQAKGLKKGDYVEIEGELRSSQREIETVKDKKKTKIKITDWEIRASKVSKLAKPESSRGENFDAEPVTEDDAA